MKKVRHPFIVELLDDIKSQQNIFLIIELVRGGDLYDFITESGMFQRAYGLLLRYSYGIIYRPVYTL